MSRTKVYTHTGVVAGACSRVRVRLRRGKVHWITERGRRFSLKTGSGVGTWPRYHLMLETVTELVGGSRS